MTGLVGALCWWGPGARAPWAPRKLAGFICCVCTVRTMNNNVNKCSKVNNNVCNISISNINAIVLLLLALAVGENYDNLYFMRFGSASLKVHYSEACVPKLVDKLAKACYISVTGTNPNLKP